MKEEDRGAFGRSAGEFGKAWAREIKGDPTGNEFPTINEMLEGLLKWLAR